MKRKTFYLIFSLVLLALAVARIVLTRQILTLVSLVSASLAIAAGCAVIAVPSAGLKTAVVDRRFVVRIVAAAVGLVVVLTLLVQTMGCPLMSGTRGLAGDEGATTCERMWCRKNVTEIHDDLSATDDEYEIFECGAAWVKPAGPPQRFETDVPSFYQE